VRDRIGEARAVEAEMKQVLFGIYGGEEDRLLVDRSEALHGAARAIHLRRRVLSVILLRMELPRLPSSATRR